MTTCSKPFLFGLLLVLGLCGCGQTEKDYIQTTRSGIGSLPWPKQMEALFGDADHFITHYGMASGPRPWNTVVYFGGRYELALQVDVEINYRTHKIVKAVSPPKFHLSEIGSLIRNKANQVEGADIAKNWVVDEVQWNQFVQANGDWSVIGITVRTNDPIPGFDEYVKGWRSLLIKVPH